MNANTRSNALFRQPPTDSMKAAVVDVDPTKSGHGSTHATALRAAMVPLQGNPVPRVVNVPPA
jgi:hypothetical protein